MSLYPALEISRKFFIVCLIDLFIKRNKGILFSLVGMSFSGTYQDWYLACRGILHFEKVQHSFLIACPLNKQNSITGVLEWHPVPYLKATGRCPAKVSSKQVSVFLVDLRHPHLEHLLPLC